MSTSRFAGLLLPLVLVACKSGPPRDVVAGAELERYSEKELVAEVKALVQELDFPEDPKHELSQALERLLADPKFRAEMEQRGVTGVCAFAGGSGGLIVVGGGANGLASFKGGRRAVPFGAGGTTVGAVVGGQTTWGFGLLLGLRHEAWFPGDYTGKTTGATAVQTSVSAGQLQSDWHDHAIRTETVGAGLSASAGRTNVTVDWKQ